MTTKPLIHKCPDCPMKFASLTGLGSHRRSRHGIAGSARSTVAARELAARTTANPPLSEYKRIRWHLKEMKAPENPAPFQCPHCGYQTKNKAGLSLHVNRFHAQLKAGDPRAKNNSLQCPHCEFIGTNKGGLVLHRRKRHNEILAQRLDRDRSHIEPAQTQVITVAANIHHEEEAHFAANGIPEATLALALGRFQGLCSSMATEFDLPPRNFATRLAELIYRSQVR